jgi:hypothetical protein
MGNFLGAFVGGILGGIAGAYLYQGMQGIPQIQPKKYYIKRITEVGGLQAIQYLQSDMTWGVIDTAVQLPQVQANNAVNYLQSMDSTGTFDKELVAALGALYGSY